MSLMEEFGNLINTTAGRNILDIGWGGISTIGSGLYNGTEAILSGGYSVVETIYSTSQSYLGTTIAITAGLTYAGATGKLTPLYESVKNNIPAIPTLLKRAPTPPPKPKIKTPSEEKEETEEAKDEDNHNHKKGKRCCGIW